MPLNEKEKKLIMSFVASPMFSALKKIIQERIEIIKNQPNKKETEFETIYQLGNSNGRQEELNELIKTLEIIYQREAKK